MKTLTITGRPGGNQVQFARLLAQMLRGLGCHVLVEDGKTTTPYYGKPGQPPGMVPTERVYLIRCRDRARGGAHAR